MTQSSTPLTSSDVVDAFGRSERFPTGSEQFEVLSPYVGKLVEIVGEDRLDSNVGLGSLCDVTGRFVRSLAEDTSFTEALGAEGFTIPLLYNQLADQLEGIAEDPEAMLAQLELTETQALEMDALGLNDAAKELLHNNELTFAKLLLTSPDVFIPRS